MGHQQLEAYQQPPLYGPTQSRQKLGMLDGLKNADGRKLVQQYTDALELEDGLEKYVMVVRW